MSSSIRQIHDITHLARLLGFLLELLDGSLVNTSTLVDQMTSGGGLTRVHMANDHNVDMNLFLSHFGRLKIRRLILK